MNKVLGAAVSGGMWRVTCLVAIAAATARADSPASIGVALDGPYRSFPDFVSDLQHDGSYAGETLTVGPRSDHAAVLTISDGSRKSSFVALQTEHGWLVDRVLGDLYHGGDDPDWVLHDNLKDTYVVVDLVEHGSWIVLRAIQAGFHRTGEREWFYCTGLEVVCRRGVADATCSRPLPVAGRAACHPRTASWTPASWREFDWNRPIELHDDGTITVSAAQHPAIAPALAAQLPDSLVTAPGTYAVTR